MSLRTTPEEVFWEAQTAMAQGKWERFFACLDRNDLLRIAENSLNALLNKEDEGTSSMVESLADDHSFPLEALESVRNQRRAMAESAMAILESRAPSVPAVDPKAMVEQSLAHRQIVLNHKKVLKGALKSVPDLAGFTAILEREMRRVIGGGSVSSKLFVGEMLENVSVEGDKAWATRRRPHGGAEDVGFVKRKGIWYIKLFARRRAARSGQA